LERDGFIWFWPGDPDGVDEARLPRFPYLSDPRRFSVIKGWLHVRGNYQLVVDNLLDLSHAAYLHPEFAAPGVSTEQALAATTTRLERRGDSVYNYRLRAGLPSPGPSRRLFGFGEEPVNAKSHMTWRAPAVLDFDLGQWEVGTAEEDGLALPQAHVITPETEFTSHYFFVNARNRRLGDPDVDAALLKVFDTAFRTQDEPMIEAVQARMGKVSDIRELKPALLSIDAAPMAARRMLAKLIAEEEQAAAAAELRS
jgi:vanillate O-demethylase monooxygenase subunit